MIYRLTKRAMAEFLRITDFAVARNPLAGAKLMAELMVTFRALARMPLMGRARPEFGARKRSFTFESYVIVYRPMPYGVQISSIVDGRRDPKTLLPR